MANDIGYCYFRKVYESKQWGGVNKKKTGRLLEGRTWDEVPVLRKTA